MVAIDDVKCGRPTHLGPKISTETLGGVPAANPFQMISHMTALRFPKRQALERRLRGAMENFRFLGLSEIFENGPISVATLTDLQNVIYKRQ